MKKFAPSLFFLLLTSICAWTQDCSRFLLLQQNKSIEVTIYNKKGEPNGKLVYTVSNVSNSGGVTSATLTVQQFDKKDRVTTGSTTSVKCTGGALQMDLKMLMPPGGPADRMPNTNVQVTGNNIVEYPVGMKAGDTLKAGNLYMTANNGPFSQALTLSVYDRKVVGQDTVTTAAGHWNCVKITYKSKSNFKSGPLPAPSVNIDGTEWYAPGVGIVKTETQHGSTAITSIK